MLRNIHRIFICFLAVIFIFMPIFPSLSMAAGPWSGPSPWNLEPWEGFPWGGESTNSEDSGSKNNKSDSGSSSESGDSENQQGQSENGEDTGTNESIDPDDPGSENSESASGLSSDTDDSGNQQGQSGNGGKGQPENDSRDKGSSSDDEDNGNKPSNSEDQNNHDSDKDDDNDSITSSTPYKIAKITVNDVVLGTIKNNSDYNKHSPQTSFIDKNGKYTGINYNKIDWKKYGRSVVRSTLSNFVPSDAEYTKLGFDAWNGVETSKSVADDVKHWSQYKKSRNQNTDESLKKKSSKPRKYYNKAKNGAGKYYHKAKSAGKNFAKNSGISKAARKTGETIKKTGNTIKDSSLAKKTTSYANKVKNSHAAKNVGKVDGKAGKVVGKAAPWAAAVGTATSGFDTIDNFANGETSKGIASLGETMMSGSVVMGASGVGAPIAAGTAVVGFGLYAGAKLYQNWDTVTKTAKKAWEGTKNAVKNTANKVKDFVGGLFS